MPDISSLNTVVFRDDVLENGVGVRKGRQNVDIRRRRMF